MYRDTRGDTRPRLKRRTRDAHLFGIIAGCRSFVSSLKISSRVKYAFSNEDPLWRIERDRGFAFFFVRRVPRKPNRSTLFLIDIRYSTLRTGKDLLGPARLSKNDGNDRKVNLKNSVRLQHHRLLSDVFEFT